MKNKNEFDQQLVVVDGKESRLSKDKKNKKKSYTNNFFN